jgi:hypothetical protein
MIQQSVCVSATVNENKMADMAIDSEEECEEEEIHNCFLLLMACDDVVGVYEVLIGRHGQAGPSTAGVGARGQLPP